MFFDIFFLCGNCADYTGTSITANFNVTTALQETVMLICSIFYCVELKCYFVALVCSVLYQH